MRRLSSKTLVKVEVTEDDIENSITISASRHSGSGFHLFQPISPKASASSSSTSTSAIRSPRASAASSASAGAAAEERSFASVLTPKAMSSRRRSGSIPSLFNVSGSSSSLLATSTSILSPAPSGSGLAGSPPKTDISIETPVYIEEASATAALEVFRSRKISLSEQLDLRTGVVKLKEMDDIKAKYFPMLKDGSYFMKWGSKGSKRKRFFKLSDDETKILYGKSPRRCSDSIEVSKIADLTFGPNSGKFEPFDWSKLNPATVFAFSERTPEHSLFCLEAETEEVASIWFLSLQALAPINSKFVSKGKLLWLRAILKSQQIAVKEDKTITEVWEHAMESAALKMLLLRKL